MKKYIVPLTIAAVVLALALVACGAKIASAAGSSSSNLAPNATPGAQNLTQPLPLAEQLVVGTFKLEGTSNAVDAKAAAALIPLWQAYAQLTSSNTAAQAEIDSVIAQIQSTMTPQQVQAITAMNLTRQDLFSTMSSLGLTNGFGANGTPGASGTPRARTGSGSGGGGGFFGGGGDGVPGGGPGGTNGTARPTPNATQQAQRAQFANRIPTPLMNALISLLQKKA